MGSFLEGPRKGSRKSARFIGSSVHPTSSGGTGKPEGQAVDEIYYSCRQCGMWCIGSRVASPGGANEGNGAIVGSLSDGVLDPVNQGGYCPDCGSANSRKD
jgi:hypothetical protein